MISKQLIIILSLCLLTLSIVGQAQEVDRFKVLSSKLEEYAVANPKVDKEIDISITGTIQEFAFAFSKETKINLTIDPNINQRIVSNFSETKPRDILLYMCRFYNLDIAFSGSIISLIPYNQPPPPLRSKDVLVKYNDYNKTLELDLHNDTLDIVVKKISELSKSNVIATKEASSIIVNGYVGVTDFEDALEQFCKRNDLSFTKDKNRFYTIDKLKPVVPTNINNYNSPLGNNGNSLTNSYEALDKMPNLKVQLNRDSNGNKFITINAVSVAMADIVRKVSKEANENFFLYTEPVEKATFSIENATYEDILYKLFNNTKYTFRKDGKIYLIGDRKQEGIGYIKAIQLKHRTVKDFNKAIPKDLLIGNQVQEFIELNSLIVSGSPNSINELESFIEQIDKSVPVINIELLIVNLNDSKSVKLGVQAGIGKEPVTPGGTVFPGIDFTFSAKGVNQLLSLLAGNGIVNLGLVKPNFYATLQAVEDNGFAKVTSKPRLATLNGKEATFSIGETRYFKIERTTLQGNQTPISLQDRTYQSVNADFTVKITPVVSGDEFVTLDIDVKQSDFTGQVAADAPPSQVSRNFSSSIRIKNQEMIVLGGLESKSTTDNGTGVPILARIPILKWFFSKRQKSKQKTELVIFVKPTVIY